MGAEKTVILTDEAIRIATIKLAFESGMRASDAKPGSILAPWLVGGLFAMEQGRELTPQLLQDLDAAQTMIPPETAAPVKKG